MAWFERVGDINAPFTRLLQELRDLPRFSRDVVKCVHGLSRVELVSGKERLQIRTNEGLMSRHNIKLITKPDYVDLFYVQTYEIGRWTTITSHDRQEFWREGNKIKYRFCVERLEATGLLGWVFKKLARNYAGNSFFEACKNHLENARKPMVNLSEMN